MFSRIPSKDRLLYTAILALVLGVGGYAAFAHGQKPAPIVFSDSPAPAHGASSTSSTVSTKEDEVVVQVAGAVAKPGVFHLPAGSRLDDAVKAAGGARADADIDSWNLAAKVIDGSQIYVKTKKEAAVVVAQSAPVRTVRHAAAAPPRIQGTIPPVHVEVPEAYRGGASAPSAYADKPKVEPAGDSKPVVASKPSASPSHEGRAKKEMPAPGSIDLNSAGLEDLEKLPGVGPSTAQKILDYRQEHGRFQSVEELLAVKGIGPKKLDAIRDYVRV